MAISKAAMTRGIGAALCVVGMACGGAQRQPAAAEQSAAISEASVQEVGAAPQCVDDKERPVSCLSDADCCEGFVCGKDPALSHRMSYCIFGG